MENVSAACLSTVRNPGSPGLDSVEAQPAMKAGRRCFQLNLADPESHRFFYLTMAAIGAVFLGGSGLGLYLTQTTVPLGQIGVRLVLLVSLVALARFYHWRQLGRAVNLIMMAFWGITFGYLHIVPMFVAARVRVPLSDALLARMDALLGLEVPRVLQFTHDHPELARFLAATYDTLIFIVILAIMLPPLCGKMRVAKEYAISTLVAATVALPLFAIFQAVGPWTYYDYVPQINQDGYMKAFSAIKTEEWYTLDLGYHDGLICFPSFHAVLAVLAAAALWRIPYARWPALILSVLIVISTVTTGTHYVIDVVAGLGVAGISLAAAKLYTKLEGKLSTSKALDNP
jgi:membrane-associated phospholipid phosphatase